MAVYCHKIHCSICAEGDRQKFRDPGIQLEETPKEFYVRLKDLYQKWIKPAERTVEEIGEILVLEQFLLSLAPKLQLLVKKYNPHTGLKAAELVSFYLAGCSEPKDYRARSLGYGRGAGSGYSVLRGGPSTGESRFHFLPVLQYHFFSSATPEKKIT